MVARPGIDDELARQHDNFTSQIESILIEAQDKAYARGIENRADEVGILHTRLEICVSVMQDLLKFVPTGTREEIALRGAIRQATDLPA